jgi:hypothetical protein
MRVRMLVIVNRVTYGDDLTRSCGLNCVALMDKMFRNLPLVPGWFSKQIRLLWCGWEFVPFEEVIWKCDWRPSPPTFSFYWLKLYTYFLFFKKGFIALININHTCKLQNCSLINKFTTVSLQLHVGEFNLAKITAVKTIHKKHCSHYMYLFVSDVWYAVCKSVTTEVPMQ